MKNKVSVLGSGFVSSHLNYNKILDRLDLSEINIESLINKNKPDILINCIGKTGRPNIDSCENEKEITSATNTALPILLAKVCEKHSIKLIQINSGCIYFGESPNIIEYKDSDDKIIKKDLGWREDDFANPKSFYSKTKYACDLSIGDMGNVAILRIRMPISEQKSERNLISKLKKYKQVIDIPNSMTYINDLVKFIDFVINKNLSGIYHVTNPEPMTAAQIMKEYKKYIKSHLFEIIDESELDKITKAKRSNCILNTDRLKSTGFVMTPSEVAIQSCVKEYCS